jgi:alpha-glucuronidase
MRRNILLLFFLFFSMPGLILAESGENLWLRYDKVSDNVFDDYSVLEKLYVEGNSPVIGVAQNELINAIKGMTSVDLDLSKKVSGSSILLGVGLNEKIDVQGLEEGLESCGPEGYVIRTVGKDKETQVVITANTDAGVLYGTFAFIRMMQNEEDISAINVVETPKYELRLLNHWDNLDGTVERGYAGHSIWWNREKRSLN